jgi:molybdenum cofactor cytidylyltransferase
VNLLSLLGAGRGDVVAVAGAGGKSALVSALSQETRRGGQQVVEAATAQRKLPSLDPGRVADLRAQGDLVLVECDGARGRLLKTPAEHEPVVPACASVLVVVGSLAALGRPLDAGVVHRPERVAAASGRAAGSAIDPWVLARALATGYPERRPPAARLVAFLNAAEDERGWLGAVGAASGLVPPYDAVVAGSARQARASRVPVLAAVVLADGERRPAPSDAQPALRAAGALLQAGLQRVHVALSRDARAAWREPPADPRIELVSAGDAAPQGSAPLLGSALAALGGAVDAAVIVPLRAGPVGPALLERLLLAALERAPLVGARADGELRALLVPREMFRELEALEGGAELEGLLRRHRARAAWVASAERDPSTPDVARV